MEFNIRLCGEAGQGLQSVGKILLSALAKTGREVYAHQDYESRIRGGNNFFQIRIGQQLHSFMPQLDLVVALTTESFQAFADDLKPGGIGFHPGPEVLGGQFREFLLNPEQKAKEVTENKKTASGVVAGLVWAAVSSELSMLEDELRRFFNNRGDEIVEANLRAARAGFDHAREQGIKALPPVTAASRQRMLLRGNDAVALGAMAAGVKLISAYPMTPSTSITEYIAARGEGLDIRVEQAEDEIAAINMCIGAAYAGVRAMTTTSGGGFCLMTEALGLAGSAEIPVVVVNGQRPGPSTGMPTRTEQGDLLFAVHCGHGEFPLAVLAPGSVEECFYLMGEAFNQAEEYQMPVVVLTDQYLADSFQTVPRLDPGKIEIRRGAIASPHRDYARYDITEDGISPRLMPGAEGAVVVCAGDEHDRHGHLIEDAESRIAMTEKRMRKMRNLKALAPVCQGSGGRINLVTWGSAWGVVREALAVINTPGVQGIHLPQLAPFPVAEFNQALAGAPIYTVESNYTCQLAQLLRMHGFVIQGTVRRFDGRPLQADQVIEYVREVLK